MSNEALLNEALRAASRDAERPYRLVDGECEIPVPMPPGLFDDLDQIVVTVRLTDDIVTFVSPLAAWLDTDQPDDTAESLLRRQFSALHTDGVGFAIADREDVLVAQYHWIPIELTPDAFATIFARFVSASIRLRDEAIRMASLGAPLDVF